MGAFEDLHADRVVGSLAMFDRMIFKGYLTRLYPRENVRCFLWTQGVALKDFTGYAKATTERIANNARRLVTEAGRPVISFDHVKTRNRAQRKDALAKAIAERDGITEGIVCLISAVEPCMSFQVRKSSDIVPTDAVVRLAPSHVFDDVESPFAVIVPGGGEPTLAACGNRRLIDYVIGAASSAEIVMSVCTGALVLASAGLLDDRAATTHWAYLDILEGLGAKYLHQRWVEDGKFLTTAGVSAGIDGALYVASRLVGEDMAKLIQRGIEYEPQPPFGPIDWDPAIVDAVRPIWRGPLPEVLAAHPYLAREARLGPTSFQRP